MLQHTSGVAPSGRGLISGGGPKYSLTSLIISKSSALPLNSGFSECSTKELHLLQPSLTERQQTNLEKTKENLSDHVELKVQSHDTM